jgi:SHS2 domain-containing protein
MIRGGRKPVPPRGHETIDHTADMGIRGWGGSCLEAFEEVAAAMFEIMADTKGVAAAGRVPVACTADDIESLLIEFLNGLIAKCDLEGMIPTSVSVLRLERAGGAWVIEAEARAVPLAEVSDRLLTEVKAAAYYGARVWERGSGGWEARCVVDL